MDTEQIDEAPQRANYAWPKWSEQLGQWTPAPEVGARYVRLAHDDDREPGEKAYRPANNKKGGRLYRKRSSIRSDIVAALGAVSNGLICADIIRACRHGPEEDHPHENSVRENIGALCATGIIHRDGPRGQKFVRYFLVDKKC